MSTTDTPDLNSLAKSPTFSSIGFLTIILHSEAVSVAILVTNVYVRLVSRPRLLVTLMSTARMNPPKRSKEGLKELNPCCHSWRTPWNEFWNTALDTNVPPQRDFRSSRSLNEVTFKGKNLSESWSLVFLFDMPPSNLDASATPVAAGSSLNTGRGFSSDQEDLPHIVESRSLRINKRSIVWTYRPAPGLLLSL